MKNNKLFFVGIIFLVTMQSIRAQIILPDWLQKAINSSQIENEKALTNTNLTKEEYYDLAYRRVKQIDSLSMLIPDSSVGVIDATGKYINEKDDGFGLCCSGYAKWIADGYYYPLRKKNHPRLQYMSIRKLRQIYPALRGDKQSYQYEMSREPFFGLDWTRNIARELAEEKYKQNFFYNSFDVTHSFKIKYEKDRGFPIEKIPEVLKEQTLLHPNRWYLVSINGEFGENPTLIQHHHIAVFFPYINKDGIFRLPVLERTRRTSFEYLISRYPNTYCHLVWLELDGKIELNLP